MTHTGGLLCQQQISRTGTSNYIPQILWDVITCPFPWYLHLAHKSSFDSKISYLRECVISRFKWVKTTSMIQENTRVLEKISLPSPVPHQPHLRTTSLPVSRDTKTHYRSTQGSWGGSNVWPGGKRVNRNIHLRKTSHQDAAGHGPIPGFWHFLTFQLYIL